MADEHDLGSCAGNSVRVRVPPSPPLCVTGSWLIILLASSFEVPFDSRIDSNANGARLGEPGLRTPTELLVVSVFGVHGFVVLPNG